MEEPSRHTSSPDPAVGKPQRKELPGQFAAWAAGVTDRPEEQEGERLNSPFVQTARLLLQIPWPRGCTLVRALAIGSGGQSKSWKRLAAARTGNLSSGSKMEVGRNGLHNPSSPSSSSPKARRAPQQAGVSNHLPRRGFLGAWEKPQHLSRVLERGFIASSGARADKLRCHAKKTQQQISVQRGWFSSTQRHRHAPSLVPCRGLSAPKADPGTQPEIPPEHPPPSRHSRCCPWGTATTTLPTPAPLPVPPKSLPTAATDRGGFDICRESPPCSVLIISQVQADFCSMIQAAGSRECKHGGCLPGKRGLFLPQEAGGGGKSMPGT